MISLKDKVIIVTGSSKGIGLEIGKKLLSNQAKVVFCSRKIEEEKTSLGIESKNAFFVNIDIRNKQSIHSAIEKVVNHFGSIDILINNAGDNGEVSKWLDSDPERERNIFETHVFGCLNMIRAVVPLMKERGSGLIINIGSIVGFVPMPGLAMYSAAKASVISLTKSLRHELKKEGIDLRLFVPPHCTTGHNIGRRTNHTPESVALKFINVLFKGKISFVYEEYLVILKRYFPKITQAIMNKTGDLALKIRYPE
ncbi:SDR family NAD(P)-dependent oxidoreductase [Leptospira adleri]|uniref:SDR family NAD(P)-dependent oxidoreductase n=1 Tax=Leptospira adleri TaxID=2023186 RepID=UPI001438463F|nr:SDR family NAD(P)-dependent oxidoreductase [Leptospira adleri]